MLINEFNFTTTTFEEARENDTQHTSSFPLFNMDALRDSFSHNNHQNFLTQGNLDDILEEIVAKKGKNNHGKEVIAKKRGRKAVPKDGKSWDDPTITMKEIIENDLVGEPTVAETEAKIERLRKMREAKAEKRAKKNALHHTEANTPEDSESEKRNHHHNNLESNVHHHHNHHNVPQIVFKDGQIVVEAAEQVEERTRGLVLATDNSKKKLNSMSYRTKNHTNKWTEEETRKFYKAIEIFGADFSMIAKLFPTRNRNQVKNKYNKESKVNALLVDEAFKKNTQLNKRSIMERVKLFESQVKNVRDGNELVPVTFERNYSNTSTDSLDYRVLEEIQDVFVSEMKADNKNEFEGLFNVENTFNLELDFFNREEENESELTEENVVEMADSFVNYAQEPVFEQRNLLLRLFN